MTEPKLGRCSTCDFIHPLTMVTLSKHTDVGLCAPCATTVLNWQRMEAIEQEERRKQYRKAAKKRG